MIAMHKCAIFFLQFPTVNDSQTKWQTDRLLVYSRLLYIVDLDVCITVRFDSNLRDSLHFFTLKIMFLFNNLQ